MKPEYKIAALNLALCLISLCASYPSRATPGTPSASASASTSTSASADSEGDLTTPRGGWNHAGLIDKSGDTRSSYPNPPIDRGSQKNRTLIEGHIRATTNARLPALVANGNAMVLNTDQQGKFARHYTFGAGSNSVEIKNGNGKSVKRVQFYEAKSGQLAPQLRIICSWDAPEAEVDMHIITPDGQHAFYAAPVLNGGGGLDVDSVDGPGPEMFTTIEPLHGLYHVYINYWGNFSQGGYNFDENQRKQPIITTQITLIYYENTVREKRETFTVPLRKIGDLNLVKSFLF
jgi:uncharacterized protein YfaP (DUF2135 family)